MWLIILGIVEVVVVIAFSVALGIGLFTIASNYLHRNQPEERTQARRSDAATLHTATLVQELYDEYIGKEN